MSPQPTVLFAGSLGGLQNVKYAYLQAVTQDYGFQPLFVTHAADYALLCRAGLPALHPRQELSHEIAGASAIVLDNFVPHTSLGHHDVRGRPILQLWHGIPLKKIGFPEITSSVNMHEEKARYLAEQYSGYAAVPSTSPWVTKALFSTVFQAAAFPELGFARNDILLRPPTKHDMLGVDAHIYARCVRHRKQGGTVAVYMPTFRDTGGHFLEDKVVDPVALDIFCHRHNILFLAKFHPGIPVKAFCTLENFVVYNSQQDIYPVLRHVDVLITDYSSIYFDFLLVNKPLIFFAYDKEKYLSRDRELFFDYESITPGQHVRTQDELWAALRKILIDKEDAHAHERQALCDKAFTHKDAQSAHRVCCYLRDTLLSSRGGLIPH